MDTRRIIKETLSNKYAQLLEDENFMYKVSFLEDQDITEGTLATYVRIFIYYIHKMEKALEKDLYEFNTDEIKLLMNSITTTSMSLKQTVLSLIKNYDNWAYNKGYRNNINDLRLLEGDELTEVDGSRIQENYISIEDTYRLASYILSTEDTRYVTSVIMLLALRHGLKGEELSEVFNLEYSMVDRENLVIRYNCKKYSKEIEIDERFIYFMDEVEKLKGESVKILSGTLGVVALRNTISRASEKIFDKKINTQILYNSCLFDELEKIAGENSGVLKIEDFKYVKRKYEPLCGISSYTTLKNLYAKFNPDIKIERDKPGVKKNVSKEANKLIAKLVF